jgi:hypothetical protein
MCGASLAMLSDGGEGKIVRLGQHLGYRVLQFFRISGMGQLQAKGDEAMETSNTQQETAMKMEPQKEHQWLQRFVGEWTFEGEAMMEPGQPPAKFTGTESVRSLGDLWFLAEGQGEMPDGLRREDDAVQGRNRRVLTSHMLSDDGNWQQFMTANYWRKK